MKLPFLNKKNNTFNYDIYTEKKDIKKTNFNLTKKSNVIMSIILIVAIVGIGIYYFMPNSILRGDNNNNNTEEKPQTDMNEDPRKSETDKPKNNTKPSDNGNKQSNSNNNKNNNSNSNTNTDKKNQEVDIPKEDPTKNTDVDVPKENPNGNKQQEVPQSNQNQGQSNTPTPTPAQTDQKDTPSTPQTTKKPTPDPGPSQTIPQPSGGTDPQEKNNTTGLIATCDERFVSISRNIKEIHFIKLPESSIKARYNAAKYRDIWQWEGKGDIKDWVEGTRLYIASPKKIYFIDSSVSLQNVNGFGNEGYGIAFGGKDDFVTYNDCKIFHNLEKINFANIDTSQLKHFGPMFYEARKLKEIQNLTNFNTSNARDFNSMFENCENLQTLDLSSFDTSKVTDMTDMFSGAKSLKTIYISNKWTINALKNDSNMFKNTTSLVGGAGTSCNTTSQNRIAAHIDMAGNPGCLTLK